MRDNDPNPAARPDAAILYFSRNPNPRLALAVARHVGAPVTPVFASPFDPARVAFFLDLNPGQRVPILTEPGRPALWEADAIACRLSRLAQSDFWRQGDDQPDMIRWISWGKENFVRACDMVHFERGTKQRYGIGPVDAANLAEGLSLFSESANQLDRHLAGRDWLLDSGPSHADFRMATFLPFNDAARLPLSDYPAVAAWHDRLMVLPAWADPFSGLDAPPLAPVPQGDALAIADPAS